MTQASTRDMFRTFRGRAVLILVGVALSSGMISLIHAELVLPVLLAGLTSSWFLLERELRPLIQECADVNTEREALRARWGDVAGAVYASSEGIARVDENGRFIWANLACGAMLGYEPTQLGGMPAHTGVHPDDLDKMKNVFQEVENSRLASVQQIRTITKAGHVFFARVKIVRPIDFDAKPGFLVFFQDRNEEIEVEAALDLKSTELARLNGELEQFAYVAAHDLQEPVRKVISFAALLEKDFEGDLPEKARRDLRFIVDAAHRMQQLISDLLALSRAGRAAMTSEAIPLDDCLDAALDTLAIKIEEAGATIIRDPLPIVECDRFLITQLYQNLVSNAFKFCDADHPEIHITADPTPTGFEFGVRDNGIGIKPEYVSQIFQPFKRLHGRGEYEGTGIGLAICQKAVDRNLGEIWVESEPGKGSHFKFTIGTRRKD